MNIYIINGSPLIEKNIVKNKLLIIYYLFI